MQRLTDQDRAFSMSPEIPTGVLIHGCHLQAAGWEEVVWGRNTELMGRLPQGLLTAFEFNAQMIVIGSGASSRLFDDQRSSCCGQILCEAEFTMETLRCRFQEMKQFPAWKACGAGLPDDAWRRWERRALDATVLDVTSQTTIEELRHAGRLFADRGIQRVVLVSSPTHLPRVIRDATSIYQTDATCRGFRDRILAVPSQTNFAGTSPSDVMVLEPPHRPDRKPQAMDSIRRLISEDKEDETGLISVLSDITQLVSACKHT